MTSRFDAAFAHLEAHRRACHSPECPSCTDPDGPDTPSAADQDAWSGRREDAREYWRDAAVAS